MKILCIGDSNTYGYDPRSYIGSRYPEDVRWADRLTGHEVINCGLNGMTVPRRHDRAIGQIRSNEPDLIVVMLGTNDLTGGLSAERVAGRMEEFLDSILSLGRPVMLIAPPVLQFGEWVMDEDILEESELLGDEYRALAERKGCLFADAGKWGIELTFDGVHLSPEGHITFADKMNDLLKGDKIIWKNQ